MAVTYQLGKDAVITGVTNADVRNVSATVEASQIDTTRRTNTSRKYKTGFKDATIEIEMLDNPPASGATLGIEHANSGLEGDFLVTSVVKSEPLDDVVTFKVTCKRKSAPT